MRVPFQSESKAVMTTAGFCFRLIWVRFISLTEMMRWLSSKILTSEATARLGLPVGVTVAIWIGLPSIIFLY